MVSCAGRIGLAAFACFLASIPLANWMILHVGTVCVPQGAVPGAGRARTAGAVRRADRRRGAGAARCGAALPRPHLGSGGDRHRHRSVGIGRAGSAWCIASGSAFALSELADFAVYTPLQRRQLTLAVVASSIVGLVVDSVVFLTLAFGSLEFLAGQVVGKLWAVLVAIPLMRLLRRVAPTPA